MREVSGIVRVFPNFHQPSVAIVAESARDTFRYNYNLTADIISGYAQAQFKYNKVDFFLAASVTNTQRKRGKYWQLFWER